MSVSVNKSRFNEHGIYNLDERLQDVKKRLLQRKHTVHIESSDNRHRLEGCFCGIKAVRQELQQILKDTMKTKQMQDEIRSRENGQRMLTETKERQNISNRRLLTKTTHFIPMDKDLYDYLSMNYYDELKGLCGGSIDYCETNVAIKVDLDTAENVETVKNGISALQNRFVVRKHKVPEGINFCKLKAEVVATQKKNNATTIFDSEQKTVKVIGSRKEMDEIMQLILTLAVSEHFDGKDEVLTKNVIETDNEIRDTHPDNNSTTKLETKSNETKTLINDTELECPDKRGTSKHLVKHNMNTVTDDKNIKDKTETAEDYKRKLTDNNKSEIPDKKGTTTDVTREDEKTPTDDTKPYPDKKGTSKQEALGYDNKETPTDDTKPYPDKQGTSKQEALGYDKETPTDDTKLYPDKKETSKQEALEYDRKTPRDDTKPYPDKKGTSKQEALGYDKETPTDDTKPYPDKKGTSKQEALGYDKETPTDDTKPYPDKKGTSKQEALGYDKETPTDDTKPCP